MNWKTNPLPEGIEKPDAPPNPPPIKPSIEGGDAGPKVAEMLVDRIRELEKELEDLRTVAEDVYDLAHYRSTGPAVRDTLWVIREMLKDYI